MKIIPKLNLNKHPIGVENGSLVDANNIRLSDDNAVLCIDNKINKIKDLNVKYAIPCNKEIVYFVLYSNDNELSIIRYNEVTDEYTDTKCKIDYHENSNFVGTFTYNCEHLIIAFSEYGNDINIPLKVIDLDEPNSYKKEIQPICPEIKIPTVNHEYVNGNAYKGWYFVFVRYKISENNYTQWYNTNKSIFVDSYTNELFINYFVSGEAQGNNKGSSLFTKANNVSDTNDICNITFSLDIIDNNDTNLYKYCQYSVIVINKTTTKAFKTEDIQYNNEHTNIIKFNSTNFKSYNATDIIKSYINYYNVHTLTNCNNRLYIANYNESNINNIDIVEHGDIIDSITCDNTLYIEKVDDYYTEQKYTITNYRNSTILTGTLYNKQYIPITDGWFDYLGNIVKANYNDSITIKHHNIDGKYTETIVMAKDLVLCINRAGYNSTRSICLYNNGIFIDILNKEDYGVNILPTDTEEAGFTISKIDNNSTDIRIDIHISSFTKFTFNVTNTEDVNIENVKYAITSRKVIPNEYYNFFIHFVDKYGNVSNGYQIGNFDFDINGVELLDNGLCHISSNEFNSISFNINTDAIKNINKDIIGVFVSYEKFESIKKYSGAIINDNGIIKFYNDKINFKDKIDFDFDTLYLYDVSVKDVNTGTLIEKVNNNYTKYTIDDKHLYCADTYNNTNKSSYIKLNIKDNNIDNNVHYGELVKSDITNIYKTKNKTLIPCSNIVYIDGKTNVCEIDCNNSFYTLEHAIVFNDVMFNDATKVFQQNSYNNDNTVPVIEPLVNYVWYDFCEIPNEVIRYKSKPTVIVFPNVGINTTDNTKKSFYNGCIVESKNTIDLYEENHFAIGDCYPKSLTEYRYDVTYTTVFNKTIRRSNVVQDESFNVSWRNFEAEQYKIINENKGNIIKLVSIGLYLIAHTQHSMFLFNSTDRLKSDNGSIQLNNTDIWDIGYKEVLTSELGYAGINKESDGIVGNFGYIFYSYDNKHIFKFDNNKVDIIDTDIYNAVLYNNKNIIFGDDKEHNRLLIKIGSIILSYNYAINHFVSRHSVNVDKFYSTKTKLYIVYNNTINVYNNLIEDDASINVIFNANYESIKSIDSIIYKLHRKTPYNIVNDQTNLPVEGTVGTISHNYAGDSIRIYNDNSDTDVIDITNRNNVPFTNEFGNYKYPYWRLGNWHFNYIRNKFTEENSQDVSQRIYGNYFIVQFEVSSNNNVDNVEIETIEVNVNNGELL